MSRFDYREQEQTEYNLGTVPSVVVLTERNYLQYQGQGPTSLADPQFKAAVTAMYTFAEGIKDMAATSKALAWYRDYVPYPLSVFITPDQHYTLLVKQPNFTIPALLDQVKADQPALTAEAAQVTFSRHAEGTEVQLLHTGPVQPDSPVWTALADFMTANGMTRTNPGYRELYLDDLLTTPAAQVRTLVRIPVEITNDRDGHYPVAYN